MSLRRTLSLFTALWLQFAPMLARLEPVATTLAQPVAMLLRWLAGGAAVSGAFHAVSGATGLTVTGGNNVVIPRPNPIPGTNGVALTVRFGINSDQHGVAKAYTYQNLPPGLARVATKTDTLQGRPTKSGQFQVRVIGWENSNASGDSASFTVTFSIQGALPAITGQPANQTVVAGTDVIFSVVATGENPLSYRWFKEDLELPGTNPTLILSQVTLNSAGRYRARIDSPAGSSFSEFATLTVTNLPVPVFASSPTNQTVTAGMPATFAGSMNGSGPFTFQWLYNEGVIPGATNQTLSLPTTSTNDAGAYRLRATNAGGTALSDPAQLAVLPALMAPMIASIAVVPTNLTVTAGNPVVFTAEVSGSDPLSLTWLRNDVPIPGATNLTFTLASSTTNDAGAYRLTATNAAGGTSSSALTLVVAVPTSAPTIVNQSTNLSVYLGEAVTLFVSVATNPNTDPVPAAIAWEFNGALLTGTSGRVLTLPAITTNQLGVYVARIEAPGSPIRSAPITVTNAPPLEIRTGRELDHVHLSFDSVPGREYLLEGNLFGTGTNGGWTVRQTLRPLTTSEETLELFTEPALFFRVRTSPLPGAPAE